MLDHQLHCPVCLGSSLRSEFIGWSKTYLDAIPIELTIGICGDCGSFYLRNFVPENEISTYYPKSYYTRKSKKHSVSIGDRIRLMSYRLYKGYPSDTGLNFLITPIALIYGLIYWHRLGRFPQYVPGKDTRRALEVGYGSGSYLLDLNYMDWKCFGLDIDESVDQTMEQYGILVARDFDSLKVGKGEIDYIYSYHALEHIYDVDQTLKHCFEALANDGEFKLCVPISDGLLPKFFGKYWYDLGVPIHKQIFSISGMYALASRHGFRIQSYKFNSYSESFVGSIIAWLVDVYKLDHSAQHYSRSKIFRLGCLFVSPAVLILDMLRLGDRAEFRMIKK